MPGGYLIGGDFMSVETGDVVRATGVGIIGAEEGLGAPISGAEAGPAFGVLAALFLFMYAASENFSK